MPDDGLHHLTNEAVYQHDHRIAVLVRDVKCLLHQVYCLLQVGRSNHHGPVIAVSAAPGGLIVVPLCRLDGPQARSAPHDVYNHGRKLRSHHVADSLLFQADTRRGGRCHRADAGRSGAIHHIDGRHLRLRLDEHASGLRHFQGHILRDFILRGDRVSEEAAAACPDSSLRNGLASLPNLTFHGMTSPLSAFFNRDDGIRTDPRTAGTADTAVQVCAHHRPIPFCVGTAVQCQNVLGAH